MIQESINGYVVECERRIVDEQGQETKVDICYRVNASSKTNAYRLVQAYIDGLSDITIKGVVVEYQNQPFVGIML